MVTDTIILLFFLFHFVVCFVFLVFGFFYASYIWKLPNYSSLLDKCMYWKLLSFQVLTAEDGEVFILLICHIHWGQSYIVHSSKTSTEFNERFSPIKNLGSSQLYVIGMVNRSILSFHLKFLCIRLSHKPAHFIANYYTIIM